MAVFSITLLLLVPLSIAVIVSLYSRKLKNIKKRRRAVVITQYGICTMESTEMLEVGEETSGNQMVKLCRSVINKHATVVTFET